MDCCKLLIESKKRGIYCCPKAWLPVLRFNCTARLSHEFVVSSPDIHCESCELNCCCSISCSASLDDDLANAESSPETEIVPNINADAMKIANMPTLWFFVMLLMVIRIYNSN